MRSEDPAVRAGNRCTCAERIPANRLASSRGPMGVIYVQGEGQNPSKQHTGRVLMQNLSRR